MELLGQMGLVLVLGLGAVGSALGIGIAGQAAAGAWAREARAGKRLNFTYIILLGMPLSQTLYAMILMNRMSGFMHQPEVLATYGGLLFGLGLAGGLGQMFSSWMQGRIGAGAVRCLSEGGQGLAFLIIAMGIAETVGIFTLAFLFMMMP
jgi:V/A-type H+/Na+-transporting ATPase subunit K